MKSKKIILILLFAVTAAILTAGFNNIRAESANEEPIIINRLLKKSPMKNPLPKNSPPEDYDGYRSLYDREKGFKVDLPVGTKLDFSLHPGFVRAEGNGFTAIISREWSQSDDVSEFIRYYFNRFAVNPNYCEKNGITILEDSSDWRTDILSLKLAALPENGFDTYTYVFFKTENRTFYRIMIKYNSGNAAVPKYIERMRESFRYFKSEGKAVYSAEYKPVLPDNWTAETRALYDEITNSDTVKWGIFVSDPKGKGIDESIPKLEERLDVNFEIPLIYVHLDGRFPAEYMKKCRDQGKVVELTYQLTRTNNMDRFGFSQSLYIYTQGFCDEIRRFAREAAEFGSPFLFRLNNEMNSDWVSYGGVVNLSDPDIYIYVWRKIYGIFQEEGVNNAIWIFNPNDEDYPPAGWNDAHAYYPGDEYVQLFGVTGYNTGTYYENNPAERWRSFYDIYRETEDRFGKTFGRFNWIITEFASSSVGGDKPNWIREMFRDLDKFPQIKAAVWFSFADYDSRPGKNGVPARIYWLDENNETLDAFRDGLAEYRARHVK